MNHDLEAFAETLKGSLKLLEDDPAPPMPPELLKDALSWFSPRGPMKPRRHWIISTLFGR